MTPEEQKAIGVNKMSKAKRAALDKWIATYAALVASNMAEAANGLSEKGGAIMGTIYSCGLMRGYIKAHPEAKVALQGNWDKGSCDAVENLVGMTDK